MVRPQAQEESLLTIRLRHSVFCKGRIFDAVRDRDLAKFQSLGGLAVTNNLKVIRYVLVVTSSDRRRYVVGLFLSTDKYFVTASWDQKCVLYKVEFPLTI